MVNFGGHIKAVGEGENKGTNLYLIPYDNIKELAENISSTEPEFVAQWKECLEIAAADLAQATKALWETLFAVILSDENGENNGIALEAIRGAKLATAIGLYVEKVGSEQARLLLTRMTQIQTSALTNSEGLRKLVKKYDKHHHPTENQPKKLLSALLLPLLYSSNLLGGQAVLLDSIEIVRVLLSAQEQQQQVTAMAEQPQKQATAADDSDDDADFLPLHREDSEFQHHKTVEGRIEELDWLKRLISSIPSIELQSLVAHRGFHHIQDRNDKRPLENSLAAYEMAWTSGVHLCECDIALTKDEKLVLAHDDDLQRLALDARWENSSKRVSDLTFKELISLPLKSGLRVPLLIDVLRSAHAISDNAKLIIEIKPGNQAAASALARLLSRYRGLARCVEMIMSFDAVTMHRLRSEFALLDQDMPAGNVPPSRNNSWLGTASASAVSLGTHHRRFMSFDHFGTTMNLSSPHVSERSLSIGLSISQTNLSQMYLGDAKATTGAGAQIDGEEAAKTSIPIPSVGHGPAVVATPVAPQSTRRTFPKLMLLTVAESPKRACELQVSIKDLSPIDGWLHGADGSLDGVYLQFEPAMMTPKGAASLQEMSRRFVIGTWSHSGRDPDDWQTMDWLVSECKVRYVNTDLPYSFRKDVFVRKTSRDSSRS